MKKSHKKMEKQIINALNDACNIALGKYRGFSWLTHFVNYDDFPKSLSIVCVFDTNGDLETMLTQDHGDAFQKLISERLEKVGVEIKDIRGHLSFDTEEQCRLDNNGKWNVRFSKIRN